MKNYLRNFLNDGKKTRESLSFPFPSLGSLKEEIKEDIEDNEDCKSVKRTA